MTTNPQFGSQLLDTGKTPVEWETILAERGLGIKERQLREKAHCLGACYGRGKAMIITPDQIDTILRENQSCHLKFIDGEKRGGREVILNSKGSASPHTIGAALAHLRKQADANGAKPKRTDKSVVNYLGTKRY